MESLPKKTYQIRVGQSGDVLPIIDLALHVRGVLHFPPAQIEWMLKQENSDFISLLAFEETGNIAIQGFLIGKKKTNQFEILELYSEKNAARDIYHALLLFLSETGKKQKWEGITFLTPGGDPPLQEGLLDAAFYRSKIIPSYYVDGGNAELWLKSVQ